MGKIEQLRDVNILEDDQPLEFSLPKEESFYYPDLIEPEKLTTNTTAIVKSDSDLFDTDSNLSTIINLDTKASPPCRSTRIQYMSQRYDIVAQHFAMSTVVQEVIHKRLTYLKTHHSHELKNWQKAIQEEYDTLIDNDTQDTVVIPDGQKVLKSKWIYKLKISSNGTISRYNAKWVAKGYEPQKDIDNAETFSPVIKSCNITISFALAAYHGWFIEDLDTVTAYLNENIDVLLYLEWPDGYKQPGIATLLRKTIYSLNQSAC